MCSTDLFYLYFHITPIIFDTHLAFATKIPNMTVPFISFYRIIIWFICLNQSAFSATDYALKDGILTLPKIRISSVNAPASCVTAKLLADNKNQPSSFQIASLEPVKQGYSEFYEKQVLLGDFVWLKRAGSLGADLFNLKTHEFKVAASMPVQQINASYGVNGHKLYQFGGITTAVNYPEPGHQTKVVSVYDLDHNTWETLTHTIPELGAIGETLWVHDRFYVLVKDFSYSFATKLLTFEPALDRWTSVSVEPNTTSITVFGNQLLFNHTTLHDLINNTSATLTPLNPVYPASGNTIQLGNQVYIYDRNAEGAYALSRYDLVKKSWSPIEKNPYTFSPNVLIAADNHKLIFFDAPDGGVTNPVGTNNNPVTNQLIQRSFDTDTLSWHTEVTLNREENCATDAVYAPESGQLHLPVVTARQNAQAPQRFQVDLQLKDASTLALKQALPITGYQPPHTAASGSLSSIGQSLYLTDSNQLYSRGSNIYRYNLPTKNWENLGKSLHPFNQSVTLDGKLYLLGTTGESIYSTGITQIQQFSPQNNSIDYITASNPPSALSGSAATIAYNNNIILLGGSTSISHVTIGHDTTSIFNPNTHTWQSGIPLPSKRGNGAAAVLNNEIYYSGGYEPYDYPQIGQLFHFNLAEQRWDTLAPLPVPMSFHQMLAYQGELYVFKNTIPTSELATVVDPTLTVSGFVSSLAFIYNPTQNTLRKSDIDTAELGVNVKFQVINDELYAVTGESILQIGHAIWHYNREQSRWDRLSADIPFKPSASIHYQGHIQDIGWGEWEQNGATLGQINNLKRLEAIRIVVSDLPECNIQYRAKVQTQGWTDWGENGASVGTTGKNLPLEKIQIKVDSAQCEGFIVKSRVNLQNSGWQPWVKNVSALDIDTPTTDEQNSIVGLELQLLEAISLTPAIPNEPCSLMADC